MWQIVFTLLYCIFNQKTAYEMRISDWSSDVCSSDLAQKNIGDASDRVGAIKCGGAVCDDLDSIQRRERNRRNIDALYGTVIRNAVPVDERKRRVGPKSTQVKRGGRADILIPTLCATTGTAGVLTASDHCGCTAEVLA